jgi:hypothetical protein
VGARWWPICQCKFRGLRRCNRSYNPDSPPVGNGVEICSCRMVVLYDPGVGFEVRFLRGTFATQGLAGAERDSPFARSSPRIRFSWCSSWEE